MTDCRDYDGRMRAGPRVLVFPAYRDNPFLNQLALAPRAAGVRVEGAHEFDELLRRAAGLGRGDVLHLHWTTPIAQQAPSERAAARRLTALRALFAVMRRRGAKIVWTVHNRLPHELAFRELEIRLHRLLAEHADAIHVMSTATRDLLRDIVDLPTERIRQIPHPSYEGVYDTGVSRAEARASFDLDDERAVMFAGQIRPYKGVDALVDAVGRAAGRPDAPPLALMIGGVVKEMSRDEFAASLPEGVPTVAHLAFLPDDDLARWFRAADVAVFPYRAILNSGSVHLAATFRTPVVLPDEAHLRDQFAGQSWVRFFDPSDAAASIADLLADPELFAGVDAASFDAFLDPITPWRISRRYGALLEELSAAS